MSYQTVDVWDSMPLQFTKRLMTTVITYRQAEILHWLAKGKKVNEVASILGITPRTLNFHLHRAMQRLNSVTTIQAVAVAIRTGLI